MPSTDSSSTDESVGKDIEPTLRQAMIEHASLIRNGLPCTLSENQVGNGSMNVIHIIEFDDGVKWAARVLRKPQFWKYIMRGVMFLDYLRTRSPSLKVPKVQGHSSALYETISDNPYVFLEWLDGIQLSAWSGVVIGGMAWQRFMNDMANFLLTLWTLEIPQDKSFPMPLRSTSYRAYLQSKIDGKLRKMLHKTSGWGDPVDFLLQRSLISRYVDREEATGTLAIAHGDLDGQNIIIDNEGGLLGVIDWDYVERVPLRSSVQYPLFIANIPGWPNHDVRDSAVADHERANFLNAIRQLEDTRKIDHRISNLLENSEERLFFQTSLHHEKVNREYIKLYGARTYASLIAAGDELKYFLVLNPRFIGSPEVDEIIMAMIIAHQRLDPSLRER